MPKAVVYNRLHAKSLKMSQNQALSRPHPAALYMPKVESSIVRPKDAFNSYRYHHARWRGQSDLTAKSKIFEIGYARPLMEAGEYQICSQANQRMPVKEAEMSSNIFVSYNRVSTARQGISGLGLDAQRNASMTYLASIGGELLAEFTEVESGMKDARPQLKAAIAMCRKTGATLLIAKLDRLARNVAFIANLLESGVRFVAVDMPNADKFMLHVYAAMAEEEGRRISERTRAALASAKARGVQLGANGKTLAAQHKAAAEARALAIEDTLRRLIRVDRLTFRQAADRMNEIQVPAAGGKGWHSTSVHRVWKRIEAAHAREPVATFH